MEWNEYFMLWKEQQTIAIHFNEIILTLRTQALGAVAATTAILVGFFASNIKEEHPISWGPLSGAFALLAVFWVALGILDLHYYHKLLEGSVESILELEEVSWDGPTNPRAEDLASLKSVDLSHHIRAAVDSSYSAHGSNGSEPLAEERSYDFEGTPAITAFYFIVLFGLLSATVFSYAKFKKEHQLWAVALGCVVYLGLLLGHNAL